MTRLTRRRLAAWCAAGIVFPPISVAESARRPRVGVLQLGASAPPSAFVQAFRQGLADLGWVEGETVEVIYRFAEGQAERLPGLAAELLAAQPDVIVAGPAPATFAMKQATSTVPIVFALAADPVAYGLIDARAPGNLTGLTEALPALTPQRLALLKELMPRLQRAALVWQPGSLSDADFANTLQDANQASEAHGLKLTVLPVRAAQDLAPAIETLAQERIEAAVVLMSPLFSAQAARLAELAQRHRLPMVYETRGFPAAGGLMSYGAQLPDVFRRLAGMVDRLLKGARPAEIPVASPLKVELVINRNTAQALGLALPETLLRRADLLLP